MKNSKFSKFVKQHKILSTFLLLMILLIFATSMPFLIGNGTYKFNGTKKQIAEDTIGWLESQQDGLTRTFSYPLYVENVYPISEEKAREECNLKDEEPADGYYAIEVSRLLNFGFRGNAFTEYNCRIR